MSGKACPDVKDLHRMVRRLAVELRSNRAEVSKPEYLLALHDRYADRITPEQQLYCVDEWAWPVARKAMKDLEAAAEGVVEDRQLTLPLSLAHIPVPKALPIDLDGVQRTVTAVYATVEDGDAYTASLQRNINACIKKLTEWLEVWKQARPVMVANPGWDFGRALEYLAKKEQEEQA
jgi:hypothetical protein